MPKLSQLTDYQTTPSGRIYVSPAMPTSDNGDLYAPTYPDELPVVTQQPSNSNETKSVAQRIADRLLGLHGEERYQLWPEKVVRSALTAIPDAYSGKIPMYDTDPETGELVPSQAMIGRAMDMATFAGVGGIGGTGEAAGTVLGAAPSLRPALKYNGRLYKGKEGQQHMDVIPDHLYNDFQQKAMSGDDISHYNFGFVNDKGHFLDREAALKYGIDTGLIDPQAGKFGALTSTLMADSSKPGMAIEATAKTAQPFYSAVEHTVNSIQQPKMTGEAWLGTIANKPGVKPEELDWTGLKSFLEENKGKPVTKQQVQDYIAANKVELKEVQKGGEAGTKEKAFELAKEHGWKSWDEIDAATQAKYMQRASREAGENPTKYHSYQLPGGENYREMLLTLPSEKPVNFSTYARDKFGYSDDQIKSGFNNFKDPAFREWEARQSKIESAYKSSHWDEPNILAHVRMNDRTIEGKKSLHLEEIQSDWHQQGRDKGYAQDIPQVMAYYELNGQKVPIGGGKTEAEALASTGEWPKVLKDAGLGEVKFETTYRKGEGVPDAPFKKSWHELALKRMLREAAEKGYDRLSWTPGEAQAARYDLSKQISDMKVLRSIDGKGYTIDATLKGRGERTRLADNIPPEKLADTVGKEMAQKIKNDIDAAQYNVWGVKNKTSGNWSQRFSSKKEAEAYQQSLPESVRGKTEVLEMAPKYATEYSGLDLKIGGEGMKGFYDQIIPKALSKISGEKVKIGGIKDIRDFEIHNGIDNGKPIFSVYDNKGQLIREFKSKHDAEQYVAGRKAGQAEQNEFPVHYIDIPQSLKDKAMQKGFPLFSSAYPGYIFKPVDGNPFEEKK